MAAFDVEKYPHGTRVFKTRVLPFYFFLLLRVLLPRILFFSFFFVLRHYRFEDQIVQSPTWHSIVHSTRSAHPTFNHPIVSPFFLCSSKLQIIPLQICSPFVLLQIILPLFFFKTNLFQVQKSSLETQFCLLELKSIKLEIYVVSYCQLTKWESSL